MAPYRVILLPGSVLPAAPAYAPLIAALGSDAEAVAKDLEVYATPEPPPDYTLDLEVEGLRSEAEARGWNAFHLVGYSGGGASALAFAAKHPEHLSSLALLEPAWAGSWDMSATERSMWRGYEPLESLPSEEFMRAFIRMGIKPGVDLPQLPVGDPPPWMAKRPAGIRAFMQTFKSYELDRDSLMRFARPVYFALGGLSNPDQYEEIATRLSNVFPDFQLEVFDHRHHFDPPHRIEPERLAESLKALWRRAEQEPITPGP